jgi:hypothetical protein
MSITGVDCLTVPCEQAKESERKAPRPIYLWHGYICPFCGGFYFRYKPCSHHMGMTMNIPCACKEASAWHKMSINQGLECCFCNKKFHTFEGLGTHVKVEHKDVGKEVVKFFADKANNQEEVEMGKSIADIKKERGIGGPPMLRGQDMPKSVTSIKIKVKELRESPANFKSPFIIDLETPVHDREAFAVNITNLRALATLVGLDPETADVDVLAGKVKGKTFTLYVSMTNNPSSKKMVRSLFFDGERK